MRNDAPILHRSHSTPAPTLHKRASSGTGAQIVPLMPSRVKSEKPADEDDILDYSVWEKEVEALSARVQRLASISRCPELVAVARQHSRKAEQVRVVRTAEPVSLERQRFFHPRRELEDYPDAEQKEEKKKPVQKQEKEAARAETKKKKPALATGWEAIAELYSNAALLRGLPLSAASRTPTRPSPRCSSTYSKRHQGGGVGGGPFHYSKRQQGGGGGGGTFHYNAASALASVVDLAPRWVAEDAERRKEKKLLEKQEQKQKKEAARAEKKKKKLIGKFAHLAPGWVAAVQPVLPDGWFLMEQLHGRSYYYHKSGASQFDKPTARVPDEEPEERLRAWPTGDSAYDNYY